MNNSLLMKELSANSLFDRGYILHCMRLGASDGAGVNIPAARESSGVRFLMVAAFHDATLVSANVGERYGRSYAALTVDFRTADTVGQFKNNYSQFVLRFLDVRDFSLPKWTGAAWIVYVGLKQNGERIFATFELTYFVGNEPYYADLIIDCSGVEVAAM